MILPISVVIELARALRVQRLPDGFRRSLEDGLDYYFKATGYWEKLHPAELVAFRRRRLAVNRDAIEEDPARARFLRTRGGSPHGQRQLLRYHVFQAFESSEMSGSCSWGRRGPVARVMSIVLEHADQLEGKQSTPRAEFKLKQWRDWVFEYHNS